MSDGPAAAPAGSNADRAEVLAEDWFASNAAPTPGGGAPELPQAQASARAGKASARSQAPRRRAMVLTVAGLALIAIGGGAAWKLGLLGKQRSLAPKPLAIAPEPKPAVPVAAAAPAPSPAAAVDLPAVPPGPAKPRVGTDALLAGGAPNADSREAEATKQPTEPSPSAAQTAPPQAAAKVRTTRGPSFEPERRGKAGRADSLRIRRIGSRDKKLLDLMAKKADTAPTAPVEKLDLDTAAPALDEAQVARTVAENRKAFDACISRSLRRSPGLQLTGRKVMASFTIRPDGSVVAPALDDAQIDALELGTCLKAVCRRLAFPAFGGDPIEVAVPLALSRVE